MPIVKNTTALLKQLRSLMKNIKLEGQSLSAYIIPTQDSHSSEIVSECDQRRSYISGFTGSDGLAIITEKEACLWTDGRYFLQAAEEMDSNWTLMKVGLLSTPLPGIIFFKFNFS